VAADVAERFLDDAKQGQFHWLRKTSDFAGDLKIDLNLGAVGKTVDQPAGGGEESRFVEERRMEKLREGANFLEAVVDPLGSFRNGFFVGL